MLGGPKGTEGASTSQCGVCGQQSEPFVLPGNRETYCLQCSADVATAILLMTEINAAKIAGQETEGMKGELDQVSKRLLGRALSA
jgi:hypothetical protein